jgi:lipopolysaccharide export system permease protein
VAAVALVFAVVLGLMDEFVVGHASRRVDEITALRFHRWGDWRSYFGRKQWFRHGDLIIRLEDGDVAAGFQGITLLRLTSDFDLAERVDAQEMHAVGETTWRLVGVNRRVFDRKGGVQLTVLPETTVDLGIRRAVLAIRPGRPEQMRIPVLRQQIRARREVGLSDRLYVLALGNRFTYPLCGVPAALVAVALALRPGRGSSLTTALVEGLGVTMSLWGLMVIGRALVNAGRMAPLVAAVLPAAVLFLALALLVSVPPGAGRRMLDRWKPAGARA